MFNNINTFTIPEHEPLSDDMCSKLLLYKREFIAHDTNRYQNNKSAIDDIIGNQSLWFSTNKKFIDELNGQRKRFING